MKSNRPLAIQLFKKSIPDLVADACQLEGINFTVPEIQTLLGGVTVGGKSLFDHDVATNQINAWHAILKDLNAGTVEISKSYSNKIHAIAAKEDAMIWGSFRNGNVGIAGTDYMPPDSSELDAKFNQVISDFSTIKDPYNKAIYLFLQFAKNQFYFDNNKRQGRFMMNAYLLDAGFPSINISKKRELEFNEGMIRYYNSEKNDASEMIAFLKSCIHPAIAKQFEIEVNNTSENDHSLDL